MRRHHYRAVCLINAVAVAAWEILLRGTGWTKLTLSCDFCLTACVAYMRAAPWCGHCKALAPKYEKAATRMAIKGHSRVFAKCDATENTVAKAKYEISGFPSLMLFKHGKHIADYHGQREVEQLVAYIEKCARAGRTRARTRAHTARQSSGTPSPRFRWLIISALKHACRPLVRSRAFSQAARSDRRARGGGYEISGD